MMPALRSEILLVRERASGRPIWPGRTLQAGARQGHRWYAATGPSTTPPPSIPRHQQVRITQLIIQ